MFKLVDRLSVGLSKASLRQTVLSNNLANFNTPGFKRSDVVDNPSFARAGPGPDLWPAPDPRQAPAGAGGPGCSGFFGGAGPHNHHAHRRQQRGRGPGAGSPLENQLYYESLIDAVSRKLGQLRSVIGEGGGSR